MALVGNEQDYINQAQRIADDNTFASNQMAKRQNEWQEQANAKAMAFSSREAEKNRQWQENLSSTAHQRETKDLISAGLNPVLSAMKGGASTPSGSSASGVTSSGSKGEVDTGVTHIVGQLLNAVIGQATALQTTSMNNQTSLQAQSMGNKTALQTSQIGANAMMNTANINAKSNQTITQMNNDFEEYVKKNYPQNQWGTVSSIFNNMKDAINQGTPSSSKQQSGLGKVISHMFQSFDNPDWGKLGKKKKN